MFVRNKSIKTFYLETVASGQIQVHNASSSEKVHPLSSYSKIHRYIYLEPFWTGFACKRCLICAYFSPDLDSEITFSQEKAKLWIEDINWWTAVLWITCVLLWCFYQLFGLCLTAPIHCRGSIEQVMQCYISPNLFRWRNKLISIFDGLSVKCNFFSELFF